MAAPNEAAHARTWRVMGVMGLVAILAVGVSYWIRNSSEVDSGAPVTTEPGVVSSSSPASSEGPSLPVSDGKVTTEPCGFVATGLIDAVRECRLLRPAAQSGAPVDRLPVVVFLHGLGGDVATTISVGGIEPAVATYRFVAVVPQGLAGSWNAGRCCGLALATGFDDVTYLRSLISLISKRSDVDTARIYVAGFSNGGMMAYRLLCDASDTIAKIASVMGTDLSGCSSKQPRSVLHIAGTADTTVPYDGGKSVVAAILGVELPPVEESMKSVAATAGCSDRLRRVRVAAKVTRTEWRGCTDGVKVDLVTITGADHVWPTGRPVDATLDVLQFFDIAP